MPRLDETDRKLLAILVDDARVSLKDLASEVGLSSPSVGDRLGRLKERGLLRRFTIDLDPVALGYPLQAIVRIRPMPGKVPAVQALLESIPEIVECDKVTGDDCFIARLFLTSIEHLDGVLDRIATQAETSSSIVKSQPVRRRPPSFR